MKFYILCLSLLLNGLLFAQDYQTVKSNQIHFFGASNLEKILATRTDSVLLSGTDSVFYSFSTMRQKQLPGQSGCDFERGAPWYGQNVIIKQNGDNCFLNKDLDTITLKTNATLNDTFLVYTYPNGNWIKGWISSIYQDTYLGQLDSIKDISLFSNDSSFVNNGIRLRIGKELGFVSILPFYSFPEQYGIYQSPEDLISGTMELVGSENPRIGISRRTVGEIFDFHSGDAVQWWESTWSVWSYIEHYYKNSWEITNRQQYGQDSVEIDIFYSGTSSYFDPNPIPPVSGQSSNSYATNRTYYNLDSLFFKTLPEEVYWENEYGFSNYGMVRESWMSIDHCGKICEGYIDHGLGILLDSMGQADTSNCISQVAIEPEWWTLKYVEGNGGPYVINGASFVSYYTSHIGNVSYWEDGTNSCGNFSFIGVDESEKSKLQLYPNPSNGLITVITEDNFNGWLKVFDLSGKTVFEDMFNQSYQQVDLTHLTPGTYLLEISTDLESRTEKLIVH